VTLKGQQDAMRHAESIKDFMMWNGLIKCVIIVPGPKEIEEAAETQTPVQTQVKFIGPPKNGK